MANGFHFTSTQATRGAMFLRLFLCGAGGSGKTYSALAIACALAERLKLPIPNVIDSEHGSALRYAKSPSGKGFAFAHTPMPEGDYSPERYEQAFTHVIREGAKVVLVDSISHEWDGANGCLEQLDVIADRAEKSGRKADNFSAWRTITPMHRHFLEAMLSMPAHLIVTIRAKTAYESRKDERGKMKFEKVGLGPIQREGIEFESDIFGWMADATLTIDKTRCDRIEPGSTHIKPGSDFAALLADWIEDVAPAAPPAASTPLDRAKAGTASPADVALLLADPSGNVRVHGWTFAIRAAPIGELDAIAAQLAGEPAARLKRDMLDAIAARKLAEATDAGAAP